MQWDSTTNSLIYGDNSITLEGVERLRMLSGKEELASFVALYGLGDEAFVDLCNRSLTATATFDAASSDKLFGGMGTYIA